mmetsp:Transcript_2504/g.5310  ORF Transcript_2504/g.5310 Transcript_2504/m.5310 type:complete len:95 (+) Transcript_2504:1291-1575(+)
MPSPRKAHASETWVTYVVSHKPHFEQWDFAGNLSGQKFGSMGCGCGLEAVSPFVEKNRAVDRLRRTVDRPEHGDAKNSNNPTMQSRRTPRLERQ